LPGGTYVVGIKVVAVVYFWIQYFISADYFCCWLYFFYFITIQFTIHF